MYRLLPLAIAGKRLICKRIPCHTLVCESCDCVFRWGKVYWELSGRTLLPEATIHHPAWDTKLSLFPYNIVLHVDSQCWQPQSYTRSSRGLGSQIIPVAKTMLGSACRQNAHHMLRLRVWRIYVHSSPGINFHSLFPIAERRPHLLIRGASTLDDQN